MLINDNLDWGLKDIGESGLKGSQSKHTHVLSFTHTYIHTQMPTHLYTHT